MHTVALSASDVGHPLRGRLFPPGGSTDCSIRLMYSELIRPYPVSAVKDNPKV